MATAAVDAPSAVARTQRELSQLGLGRLRELTGLDLGAP